MDSTTTVVELGGAHYTVGLIIVNRLRCIEMIHYVIRFIFVRGSFTSVQLLSSQIVMNKFEVGHVKI